MVDNSSSDYSWSDAVDAIFRMPPIVGSDFPWRDEADDPSTDNTEPADKPTT